MKKLAKLFFIIHILNEANAATEECATCHPSKTKIFLDSVASFLQKAQDLNGERRVCCPEKPMDCEDILASGNTQSGAYDVWPRSRIAKGKVQVYCDMTTDGGGWTVFQRRGDYGRKKDYFFNDWNAYKTGFGRVIEDHWLGNEHIFCLTNQRSYSLRIDMKDLENNARYAVYDKFWIDREEYNYKLYVTGYAGNAGDSFGGHSGFQFSTKDRDSDVWDAGSCAVSYGGGWWYAKCHSSNLNGLYLNGTHESYANGIEWSAWKFQNYSLPSVDMKIRSTTFITSNTISRNNENCKT